MNKNINTKNTSAGHAPQSWLRMLFMGMMMVVMGFGAKAQCTTWLSGGYPATVNGVTITRTAQYRVAVNSGAPVNFGSCGVTFDGFNNTTIGYGTNTPSSLGDSYQTFTFSVPVNNIRFGIAAGNGSGGGVVSDQITLSVNNGTSSVTQGANCYSVVNGNVIDFRNAPNSTTVGDGLYTLNSTLPYTTVTFTGLTSTRVYSNFCSASITPAPTCIAPTSVTVSGSDGTYCQGASLPTLNASFSGTNTGVSYQWRLNGTNIPGATGSSYTPSSTPGTNVYSVYVQNSCGNATGGNRTYTINSVPVITSNPSNGFSCNATNNGLTYSVTASGTAPLSYQWFYSDDAGVTFNTLAGFATYPGNNTPTLTTNGTEPNGRQYRAVVTNTCGSVTSLAATFTLVATPLQPAFTQTPATCSQPGTTTISNYNATYNYIFTPSGPSAGAGGVISGTIPATSYTVKAVNGTCESPQSASFSNAAATGLNVLAVPSFVVCSGVPTTLNVSGNTGTVNWSNSLGQSGTGTTVIFAGGQNISGAQQTVTYNFIETGSPCSIPTSAVITINPAPNLQVDLQKIGCNGTNTILLSTATPATSTINWVRTGASAASGSGASPLTVTQALPAGTYNYSFTATGTNGCISNAVVVPVTAN